LCSPPPSLQKAIHGAVDKTCTNSCLLLLWGFVGKMIRV
jgi:hypothetical protein